MKTIQRDLAFSPAPEAEALIEEARRRQRRRRRAVGVAVSAGLATAISLALSGAQSSRSRRPNAPSTSTPETVGGVLRGSNTNLYVWPATQCCDPANTVYVVNLSNGKVVLRRFPAMHGGDFTYVLERVGTWLVYNDEAGVSAISSDLSRRPRTLGNATYFVPSAASNQVWLVDPSPTGFGGRVRTVSVSTGRFGRGIELPKDTSLVEGTVRGLLLVSAANDLELWRPGGVPTRLAHMTSAGDVLFAADARVVAYGTGCRSEEANSVGYSLCSGIRVVELRSGRRLSFRAPPRTLGWETSSCRTTQSHPETRCLLP